MTLWSRSDVKSRDKSKAKYLLLCKTNGHQTWQSGDLWRGKLTETLSHVTNWKVNICPSANSMTTKHGRWELMLRGTHLWSHIILWQIGDVWSRDKLKVYNTSSLARPMDMKHGKLVIYGEVNAPMKSHIPLTTWSHEVTWQTENKIFLQKAYGQQTLQGADVWWGEAHNEVARLWSRDHKRSRVNF